MSEVENLAYILKPGARRLELRGDFGKWWSHGESHPDLRIASAPSCCWTMTPKVERAPGPAPGKSGVATRRLDDFGIARVFEMVRCVGVAPTPRASRARMLRLHYHLNESWSRGLESNQLLSAYEADERPVLFPGKWCSREELPLRRLRGMRSALWSGALSRYALHLELSPSQSGVHGLLHFGSD